MLGCLKERNVSNQILCFSDSRLMFGVDVTCDSSSTSGYLILKKHINEVIVFKSVPLNVQLCMLHLYNVPKCYPYSKVTATRLS